MAELEDGEAEYADGLQEYEDGKAEADAEIADAETELADAQAQVDDIEECQWYVLGRNTNSGVVGYAQDAERVGNLAKDVYKRQAHDRTEKGPPPGWWRSFLFGFLFYVETWLSALIFMLFQIFGHHFDDQIRDRALFFFCLYFDPPFQLF